MNQQMPIPADYNKSASIDVHSIFKTIQGEGPFCGQRALFIRLYGCNLRCPGCDTEYTAQRRTIVPEELSYAVAAEYQWPKGELIVLTGGEPFRQNVVPLIWNLLMSGYRVQVETNGVLAPPDIDQLDDHPGFTIVCSPKTSRIDPAVASRASAFKYVLRAGDVADDGLPTRALSHPAAPYVARPRADVPVYVQPMDEQDDALNAANTAVAVASCMTYGYTLQLQVHKILGLE